MTPEQFEQAKRKYIHSVVVSMRDLGAVIEIDEIEKFIDAGVSDLNALISEHYVEKGKYMNDLVDEYQRGFEDGRDEARNNDRL